MDILIIGNGFDLAHKLPTRYPQFLDFCRYVNEHRSYGNVYTPIYVPVVTDTDEVRTNSVFMEQVGFKPWSEFIHIIENNFWIDYFQHNRIKGDKWLDFEEEIKKVVLFLNTKMHLSIDEMSASEKSQYKKIFNVLDKYRNLIENPMNITLLHNLHEEHNKMVRAFELFIDGYVNRINVNPINGLPQIEFDHVLSFNYSNTYTRVYNSKLDCCYIHGKACSNRDEMSSDIVLGIETAFEDNANVGKEVLPFEKYVQRIVKQTDNSYLEWLECAWSGDCNIHIFGHSLATSDEDVLKYFIDNKNEIANERIKTFIYCRDEIDRAEKIINLAVILGREKLVKKTAGKGKSISFIDLSKDNMEENHEGSGIKEA